MEDALRSAAEDRRRRFAGAASFPRAAAALLRTALPAALGAVLLLALVPLGGCGETPPLESAPSAPIYVSADGRGDYATLPEAVQEAPTGATILLDPGTYELTAPLDMFRSLRIIGTSRTNTVVTSATTGHVLGFSGYGTLELRGLTIHHTGGPDDEPADVVLLRGGEATFVECAFTGAVSGRVSVRTGQGRVFETRGGAGVRALGETSLRLEASVFADDALAGLVTEPHVSVQVSHDCRGLGRPGGNGEPVVLAGAHGPGRVQDVLNATEADVPALLRAMNVPGAVVTVVKDDRLLYSRGFGLADLAAGAPVDARRTRFRVASVTKVFTATAVMQLHERGLLRLNGAVDAIVGDAPPGPSDSRQMTVADLLAHAAGFDERWIGIAAPAADAAPSLDEVVRERPAARILPPGTVSSYANYDSTLAGAAVEAAAGMSYERWVERRILLPLGMTATTFDPWTTAGSVGDVARSYRWDGGQKPLPPDRFASLPSGGLWSTGTDMAAFMLMHLGGGRIAVPIDVEAPAAGKGSVGAGAPTDPGTEVVPARDTVRILSTASVAAMHERRLANGPPLPGFTYGFAERFIQNRRALQHTGEFNGFASILFLVPSERLGVFVAANADRPRFCDEVVVRLMQRLYPDREQLGRPRPARRLAAGVAQFEGTYRTVRHAHRTLDKWLELSLRRDLLVTREPDGLLVIDDTRYVPIEPLVFRELYDDSYVTFARGAGGDVDFVFRGTSAYERLHWYETAQNQRRLVILFSIVLGCVALAWVLAPLVSLVWHAPGWVRRLLARQPFAAHDTGPARAARTVAGAAATVDLTFLAIVGAALNGAAIRYGVPLWLTAALTLPLLGAALTTAMAALSVAAWVRGWWTVTGRSIYSFVTLVAALFVWFTAYWNLLGFRS